MNIGVNTKRFQENKHKQMKKILKLILNKQWAQYEDIT